MNKNELFASDLKDVVNDRNIDFKLLENKTILITGATGLIAYTLINSLIFSEKNIIILALVRDMDKAKKMYADVLSDDLNFIVGDVCDPIKYDETVDYIIHGASVTSSQAFVEQPIETIFTAINGTKNILDFAVEKDVKSFIYLSSMEVYGTPNNDDKISENHSTDINTMDIRASYPESKRMCESICNSYYHQKNVPTKVLRLTQTFGAGVAYADSRVFAEFARCAIEEKDITLKTKGDTKRSYLYTSDCARAILIALLKGQNGQAYNVANEETYCSIYEMASLVAEKCTNNKISVNFEIAEDISKLGYANTLHMNLDTQKIRSLGWESSTNLEQMFTNLCEIMKENNNT
ncbi:MAG: NAD(P)-dependent oxidoreductase [Clostridia bacterium]